MTEGGTGLEALYREECEKQGTTPGLFIDAPKDSVNSAFVAEDPDRAWDEWGPYLLHDAKMYADADAVYAERNALQEEAEVTVTTSAKEKVTNFGSGVDVSVKGDQAPPPPPPPRARMSRAVNTTGTIEGNRRAASTEVWDGQHT